MKILLINALYGKGSTGVIVRDIYHSCINSGIECYVSCPDKSVSICDNGYLIGTKIDHKVHAVLCRIAGKQAYFSHIATKRLLRYINKLRPDIVHLHNLHSNFINLNMLLKYLAVNNVSTIITLHDCWFYTGGCFHYTSSNCYKWLDNCGQCPRRFRDTPAYLFDSTASILNDRRKYLKLIPDLTVTGVSTWISSEASRSFLSNRNILTIGNGVDTSIFHPIDSGLKTQLGLEGKFVILGPSNKWLNAVNHNVLWTLSDLLKSDEVLLLFGQRNPSVPLPPKVKTIGFVKGRKELASLYSCADVFVNVSLEDSFSLLNIEAQACGTPVITYACTGLVDTVDNNCGFTVPQGDALAIYDKIQFLRNNNLLHFSQMCRDYVVAHHNKDIVYQSYIELYEDIVHHRGISQRD